jgi:FG-GAP repeat
MKRYELAIVRSAFKLIFLNINKSKEIDMKNQRAHITRFLIIVALALIGCHIGLTAGRTASASSANQAPPLLPSLRGEAAIEHLKQTGLYHSLSSAVTAARYQMTIDPTFTQQQKLEASDAVMGDQFGFSVAISGETVVVGRALDEGPVDGDSGSAYVFVRSGGVWTQQQKLVASDAAAGDDFGFSVAISGETVVVGAPEESVVPGLQGSAYVFVRNGGVWTQQQKLEASDAAADDQFGSSVTISGETVVVGAWRTDRIEPWENQGSAYVFAPAN